MRNGQNLPHECPNLTKYFFLDNFTYNLSHFSTILRPHYQNSFFSKYFCLFSTLNSRMSTNMCIWRHKLCNAKTGVGLTFTWSNEPWSIVITILNKNGPTRPNFGKGKRKKKFPQILVHYLSIYKWLIYYGPSWKVWKCRHPTNHVLYQRALIAVSTNYPVFICFNRLSFDGHIIMNIWEVLLVWSYI